MEELRVFISSESGVIALAITPPDVLRPAGFAGLQPRFETALWLEPCRAADEYSQLWKRHPTYFQLDTINEGDLARMFKEFQEFISRGTVIDLAVGVIVGAAFNNLVSAITTYLLNPLIGLFIGQIDLSDMKFQVLGANFLIGDFINALINFLIIMFVVFMIVKMMNKMRRDGSRSKFDQNGDEIPDPQTEYLQQIRDLLRYQQRNDHNNRY